MGKHRGFLRALDGITGAALRGGRGGAQQAPGGEEDEGKGTRFVQFSEGTASGWRAYRVIKALEDIGVGHPSVASLLEGCAEAIGKYPGGWQGLLGDISGAGGLFHVYIVPGRRRSGWEQRGGEFVSREETPPRRV